MSRLSVLTAVSFLMGGLIVGGSVFLALDRRQADTSRVRPAAVEEKKPAADDDELKIHRTGDMDEEARRKIKPQIQKSVDEMLEEHHAGRLVGKHISVIQRHLKW